MKKKIWLTVAVLAVVGYAELWYSRIDEKLDELWWIKTYLSELESTLSFKSFDYVHIENERMEKSLEDIKGHLELRRFSGTDMDGVESKMEELIDELRQLNGTMNMLTH
jgi:hypothetical protein